MKINIDTFKNTLSSVNGEGKETLMPIYSREGFKLLSRIWLKQEWQQLHWQTFSWLGFPIWQFPEDLLRIQEVITVLKPDVIIETGLNQGGSAIFFASLCSLLGRGHVVSIDIQIPPAARQAI